MELYLPEVTIARLRASADREGRSLQATIEEAVNLHLDQIEASGGHHATKIMPAVPSQVVEHDGVVERAQHMGTL